METKTDESVIEVDGIQLSKKAIDSLYYFQYGNDRSYAKQSNSIANNDGINGFVDEINRDIEKLLDLTNQLRDDDILLILHIIMGLRNYRDYFESFKIKEPSENCNTITK